MERMNTEGLHGEEGQEAVADTDPRWKRVAGANGDKRGSGWRLGAGGWGQSCSRRRDRRPPAINGIWQLALASSGPQPPARFRLAAASTRRDTPGRAYGSRAT